MGDGVYVEGEGMSNTQMTKNTEVSKVDLKELSEIAGVPMDYIASELMLKEGEEVSLELLRERMLKHIDAVFLNN